MLAQGQSSSAKRGGLAVVSSGLIYLKKKKKLFWGFKSFESTLEILLMAPSHCKRTRKLAIIVTIILQRLGEIKIKSSY